MYLLHSTISSPLIYLHTVSIARLKTPIAILLHVPLTLYYIITTYLPTHCKYSEAKDSPIAILLHVPLTLYYIITTYLPTHCKYSKAKDSPIAILPHVPLTLYYIITTYLPTHCKYSEAKDSYSHTTTCTSYTLLYHHHLSTYTL